MRERAREEATRFRRESGKEEVESEAVSQEEILAMNGAGTIKLRGIFRSTQILPHLRPAYAHMRQLKLLLLGRTFKKPCLTRSNCPHGMGNGTGVKLDF